MNKEEVLTQLYREILHYATDADYEINMRDLELLAAIGGYTKDELAQIIKDIYENLPIAYSFPQEDK